MTHDFVYATFKNGKTISYPDFQKAIIVESADYFIKRKLNKHEKLPKFGNEYFNYDYELVDHQENPIFPKIGTYKLLNISSFYNTASYPMNRSWILYKLISNEGSLIEFKVLGNSMITTLELLYSTMDLILHSGGWEAYKIINDDKYILIKDDKLIYDRNSTFS